MTLESLITELRNLEPSTVLRNTAGCVPISISLGGEPATLTLKFKAHTEGLTVKDLLSAFTELSKTYTGNTEVTHSLYYDLADEHVIEAIEFVDYKENYYVRGEKVCHVP